MFTLSLSFSLFPLFCCFWIVIACGCAIEVIGLITTLMVCVSLLEALVGYACPLKCGCNNLILQHVAMVQLMTLATLLLVAFKAFCCLANSIHSHNAPYLNACVLSL